MNSKRNTIEWVEDKLVVKTRSGKTFKFEEQLDEVMIKSRKAATKRSVMRDGNIKEEIDEDLLMNLLISKSCVEPLLQEDDVNLAKLPGSEAMTLRKAIAELYDINSNL